MEKTHLAARTNKDAKGGPAMVDYRKLSNSELHRIFCAIDPNMSSFAVADDTRETVIAMLEFMGAGQR